MAFAPWVSHHSLQCYQIMVTGFSPYFPMFGRRPRLPIDLLFPTAMRQESSRTVDEYVLSLYERLKEALPVARDSAKLEAQRQKRHFDRRPEQSSCSQEIRC